MNSTKQKAIRVLVVEDSPVVAQFLIALLNSDPKIEVVGTAANGEEALELVQRTKPDVITMDIHMPRVNGFEATRKIMETCPTPIVVVSGSSSLDEVATNFQAIEAGALAVVARPNGIGHLNHDRSARELLETVKLMAEVKVVKRWPRPRTAPKRAPLTEINRKFPGTIQAVAMGASTGGPLVLQTILSGLPRDFSLPVLIVQHMTSGFVEGFVEWLTKSSGFPVRIAKDGEPLLSGHAYLAPDDFHLGVRANCVHLSNLARENGMRPAVSFLFRSVQGAFGCNAVAVLLTGMGTDGVEELKLLKEVGAITIAQDKESSVIHGMPGQAIKDGAATHVLSPPSIASLLRSSVPKL